MRKRTLILPGLAILGGAALFVRLGGEAEAPAPAGQRLRWNVGERTVYDVAWTTETTAAVAPPQAQGAPQSLELESRVEGEIAIEAISASAGETVLSVAYQTLGEFAFTMQGQDAVRDRAATVAALLGHRAFVRLAPTGEVRSIAFPPGTDAGTQNSLRALVMQLQLTLSGDQAPAWHADEAVGVGRMRFAYSDEGGLISRRPSELLALDAVPGILDGKQELDGEARYQLDGGALVAIDDREAWSYTRAGGSAPAVATRSSFTLRRKQAVAFDRAAVAVPARGAPLGETVVDPDQERRLDVALARDMTLETMAFGVDHFEQGQRPAHDFVARAGAFLRLHPEQAAWLVERFSSAELTVRGRGMILDILAQAGDANAQAAMRTILETPAAQATRHGLLLQRFTLLKAPAKESAGFLAATYRRAKEGGEIGAAQGAAVALGAVASRLRRGADAAEAQRAVEMLAGELRQATTPDMKRALVAALGNARDPGQVGLLRSLAADRDVEVRAEVAGALGSVVDDGARAELIGLCADPDSTVAMLSFASLGKQKLVADDWHTLADTARAGRTAASADAGFVKLVRQNLIAAGPDGRAILMALAERNVGPDNDLSGIIGELLASR